MMLQPPNLAPARGRVSTRPCAATICQLLPPALLRSGAAERRSRSRRCCAAAGPAAARAQATDASPRAEPGLLDVCPAGLQPQSSEVAVSQDEASTSQSGSTFTLVDTEDQLGAMLQQLRGVTCVAIDCEGVRLGDTLHDGRLTLLQLSALVPADPPADGPPHHTSRLRVWVVDVLALGLAAFDTCAPPLPASPDQITLRALLEDATVAKLLFDVRGDAAQLAAQFGIRLRAAYDLQLAEVALRQLQLQPGSYVLPLDRVLLAYLPSTPQLAEDVEHSRVVSRTYHATHRTEVWEQRPLSAELLRYAAGDVQYMHQLADELHARLPPDIVDKVRKATAARMLESTGPDGRRAEAPLLVRRAHALRLMAEAGQAAGQAAAEQADLNSAQPGAVTSGEGVAQAVSAQAWQAGPVPSTHSSGQPQARGKRRRGGKAAKRGVAGSTATAPPVLRALPQHLAGSPAAARVANNPGLADTTRSSPAAPLLLQPRQRAEGEEAPLWIYDTLKPKALTEEAEQSDARDASHSGEGDFQEPAGSSLHAVTHENGGSSEAASGPSEVSNEQTAPPQPQYLLWSGSLSGGAGQTPSAPPNKPSLLRPPPRRA